ncbi:MAG: HPr family phosphocarrier protein [Candidatus Improbicoccus pseudotrichonymphae]|uniref:HPr family phosphocarrier protein n=1 Tax=Candidatus Improbicoccus pseudotrichonymphae TaxID=3033792 RepID=A0AA48KV86_9FIRM|nr:MAG: HPr family phosphocarrier protein [Candidatus Improbicoccus pseudotrichonymphae]
MYTKTVKVQNENGLLARPSTFFIQKANEFKSVIWIEYENKRVNAKSLLGVLSLSVPQGKEVKLIAEGEDEKKAIDGLVEAIETHFAQYFK